MKRNFLTYLLIIFWSCIANANVEVILGDPLVTNENFYAQTSDCSGLATVCIDVPLVDVNNYDFTVNGTMYTGGFSACSATGPSQYDYSTLFGQGNLGPYKVDGWDVGGTIFTDTFFTMIELVDSMNLWNPSGNWSLNQTNLTINGGNPNLTYSQMDITVVSINSPTFIAWNTGSVVDGTLLSLGVGNHEVIVTQTTGGVCIDTFWVDVYCVTPNVVDQNIVSGTTGMYCFDISELPGQVSSVQMLCPNDSGTFVDFQLLANNSCVEYDGLNPGLDTSCYVICDNFGICDTTILRVTVTAGSFTSTIEWLYDTLYVGMNNSICMDNSQLNGNPTTIINDCPTSSGNAASFNINSSTYCVDYNALDIGVDTACIIVSDDLGEMDTTYIVVAVVEPMTEYIQATLEEGMTNTWCIDDTELLGNVISFENICENTTSGGTIFTLNDVTLCIEAQANTVGMDTACIVLCDDLGVCDSTFLLLSVSETITSKPIANDDTTTVVKDEDIVINICENDVIPNDFLTNNYILPATAGGVGPNYGFAIFNNDCTITYTPTDGICDVEDTFNYVICNVEGCDTALVTVTISCDELPPAGELMFTNGFSPNGDDVNDVFRIFGIENFPNNRLQIFNRWGNEVLYAEGYQNDWRGEWNGKTLQNGTYFYVLEDGEGNEYAGYVYIRR